VIDEGKQIIEEKKEDPNQIFEKVEVEASFEGGESAWKRFLTRNLNPNTPVDNGAPLGTYTVYVQFVVSKEGKVSDVRALTSHGYGMEQEAVRVIKKGPSWKPAIQNGRNVNAYRKQPITFQVTDQ
jgi:protein TonB